MGMQFFVFNFVMYSSQFSARKQRHGAFHWEFSGSSLAMHGSLASCRHFLQWNDHERFLGGTMLSMVVTMVIDP